MCKIISSLLIAVLPLGTAMASSHQAITNFNDFNSAFCKAQTVKGDLQGHVFLVNSKIFSVDKKEFNCPELGKFVIQKMADKSDPGHSIFSVEAAEGNPNIAKTYDCDSKADDEMNVIGLNCDPVGKEAAAHEKTGK